MPGPGGSALGGCLVPGGSAPGGCLVLGGSTPGVCAWSRGGVVPGGDTPHGYCCGRYASYWNAFLLKVRNR